MSIRVGFASIGLATATLGLAACASPAPPPAPAPKVEATAAPAAPQEIAKEPVDSGMTCAKAQSQCGGGVCSVAMNNTCDQPITCNLFVVTVCSAETDLVQVKARSRETFAAQSKDTVSLTANCESGRIVSTKLQSVECK